MAVKKIRVLLVDDHAALRTGLRMLVNGERDMEVVGEAGDSDRAIVVAREATPDVAVLDLSIPGAGGLATIEAIRRVSPRSRILVLTVHDDPAYARNAMARGAAGYVVKEAEAAELLSAIRAVHRGRTILYLGEKAAAGEPLGKAATTPLRTGEPPPARLSTRERRVLALVARGYTSREIGKRLSLSPKTVETYRARIATKLSLQSRADLVKYALAAGLLRAEED